MKTIILLSVIATVAACVAPVDTGDEGASVGQESQAYTVYNPWIHIQNQGYNGAKCLEGGGGSATAMDFTADCNAYSQGQLFQFDPASGLIHGIWNQCVTATNGLVTLTGDCAHAMRWSYSVSDTQIHAADGTCMQAAPYSHTTGKLPTEGGCNNQNMGTLQHWNLLPMSTNPALGSISAMATRCLDDGGRAYDGSSMVTYPCYGNQYQVFNYDPVSGQIIDTLDGRCLEVSGFNTSNGAAVGKWTCWGGTNQKWTVTQDGQVISQLNGKCMEIANYSQANGAPAQMWDCYGGMNQIWTVRPLLPPAVPGH
jgi:hypothetical protein